MGGGFLAVPALVTVLAFEMQAAIGTSLLIISVNSLASLLTRGATTSGLDWTLIAPFTGTAILGAWDGKRLAGKVSGPLLQRTFAVVLLAVAVFMLVDALDLTRRRPADSRQGQEQLLQAPHPLQVAVGGQVGIGQTVLQTGRDNDREPGLVQRPGGRGELGDHVLAVPSLLDHVDHSGDLPLRPAPAG